MFTIVIKKKYHKPPLLKIIIKHLNFALCYSCVKTESCWYFFELLHVTKFWSFCSNSVKSMHTLCTVQKVLTFHSSHNFSETLAPRILFRHLVIFSKVYISCDQSSIVTVYVILCKGNTNIWENFYRYYSSLHCHLLVTQL